MAKNIAVSDEIYLALSKFKRRNDSFSDVIKRLLPKKTMLQDLIGRQTFSEQEWKEVNNAFSTQNELDGERKQSLLNKLK